MESGEQLTTSSPGLSSPHMASSTTSSSPVPSQTVPTKHSPTTSPESHSLQMFRTEQSKIPGNSSGLNLVSHPAFGLYASSSGCSEFGGLGSLGLSALAAHSQFGTFPDWWRPSEVHTRGLPAFFPPVLGLHPLFVSSLKSHDPVDLQSRTPGVNGTVNSRSATSPTVNNSSFPAKGNKEKTNSQTSSHELQQNIKKTKEKKLNKRQPEISSMCRSQLGSLSESSSDGEESSSDPNDMEEEEEDNEDKNEQSSDSDSDSETEIPANRKTKRLTQNPSKSKKKRPCTANGNTTKDTVPLTSSHRPESYSHPAGLPQSTARFLHGSRKAEDEGQPHISVIQTTGLSVGNSPLTQSHRELCPLASRSSPNSIPFSDSSKHLSNLTIPKHFSPSSSPKYSSVSLSPKPLALCSTKKSISLCTSPKPSSPHSLKPLSHPSLPKPSLLSASKSPSHKLRLQMPSEKHTPEISVNPPDESSVHMDTLKVKQSMSKNSVKEAFNLQPQSQSSDYSPFLSLHPNRAIHSVGQDAPLALITKPHSQSSTPNSKTLLSSTSPTYPMPINLSTGTKEMLGSSASRLKSSAPRARTATKTVHGRQSHTKSNSSYPPADLARGNESDIHSSKDSDDSLGDDYNDDEDDNDDDDDEDDDDDDDDDIEDEDSGSSFSDSESNLGSDSEDDLKEYIKTREDNYAERTLLKPAQASVSKHKYSSNLSANCSPLDLQIPKTPGLPRSLVTSTTSTGIWSKNSSTLSPSFTLAAIPGPGKRRRVTDEQVLRLPLEFGWHRETRVRSVAGRLQGEVAYFAPCGKKLRQYPDVMKYLVRNGITEISRDNFSFSTKIKVGDFYEAREGPEGLQWFLLTEDEISPTIIAMDGRRSRRTKSEYQPTANGFGATQWNSLPPNVGENNFHDINDAKLLRKLEAQEIARQAAQIKMMRKLEKQAMAQAAKEAKKQQAIIAAEERRNKREQMKILKQQEKIKRIQQIRMEKELRAQQILEAKKKKKEEAANAKILEAEKRNKEKEMRRLQAVILKHQELERHRLDMERERRRQHMILMKAVEARKKAEEKERLKREKKDEKRLNKERKLELRRLELEKAKELKKPNEDMCLTDHKPLPELSRIPGLILPGSTFSDCLMVLQFLHSFGKVLCLDSNILTMSDLQEGLLNAGSCMGKVQDLLVSMLSAAVCDPGMPAGHKSKTILGDHLTNVQINRDNVSEILQIYMEAHREQTEMSALAISLRTKAFQAHSPSEKALMLAFLVNELCCSKAVIIEIERNIDYMTNLRKDKWAVEGKLRKLKNIHAKKTGKRDSSVGEDSHTFVIPAVKNKSKRKEGDSEEEEEEEDDSEDQGDDDDEEEEESEGKKGKKAEICEEEDNSVNSASIDELEKQIEKTYKQQSQIRQKLFDSSHSLRSVMIGQDRYRRRYWVLPKCGGIFVEGMENTEGYEEAERENRQVMNVKEEHQDETEKPIVFSSAQSTAGDSTIPECQQDNLFLQKPGSNLSKLLEIAKAAQGSPCPSSEVPTTRSHSSYPTSQTAQQELVDKTDTSEPSLLSSSHWMTPSPVSTVHYDQMSKILTEKSNQWFSLFPRSPCEDSSVTSGSSLPASTSSPIRTKSPSLLSTNSLAAATAGICTMQTPVLQQGKSGIHQSRVTLYDVFSTGTSPSLSSSGTPLPPMLEQAFQHAEVNGNKGLLFSVNKSETPEPPGGKATSASFPAVEVTNTQDYPCPLPMPEEMLHGWWRVSDTESLHSLVKTLNDRGIRERVLQKQIQKHMEHMIQLCGSSKDVIDVAVMEKHEVSKETVENWCVEEQAMEVDISLLRQVEALERKIISAGLQVKGWMHPEPQSDSASLVYHEHKPFSSSALDNKCQRENSQEELPDLMVWRSNNPLDIAVTRLAELERNIERSSEEEVPPGMRLWRKALGQVRSSAQLSLLIQQLQKSISWERAIMKVHCQLCEKGDNEELLLLCDGCDSGCHTYCHEPRITTVPDGDWFCPACVLKESGMSPRSGKPQSRTAGGGKRCSEVKRNSKPSAVGELINEEDASSNSMPKKATKEFKKRKADDSPPSSQTKYDSAVSCAKKARTPKEDKNGLDMCWVLLAELEAHRDAWPFLTPVNLKTVPGYRKVIKRPMDFSTIKEKLTNNQYLNLETFIIDVNLVFDNCEKFNEDDSEIGRAGHNMRRFFDKRWTELLQ